MNAMDRSDMGCRKTARREAKPKQMKHEGEGGTEGLTEGNDGNEEGDKAGELRIGEWELRNKRGRFGGGDWVVREIDLGEAGGLVFRGSVFSKRWEELMRGGLVFARMGVLVQAC